MNNKRNRNGRVAVAVVLALAAGTAMAAEDEALEEVTVTGSRIRQNPLEERAPVETITSADIARSGFTALGDFLQSLPIAGSAINRTNNAAGNLGYPPDGTGIGSGATEIDLRYLGSKRTLVLVDGRRWINGSSASGVSGSVDLNTIPANIIDSIEILQDGASTTYGSDAIGGVINVITRKDYDGKLALDGYYGSYSAGDGDTTQFDLSWGTKGEHSRVLFAASYGDQKAVYAGDRGISEYPLPGVPVGLSSGTPQGGFFFTDPRIPDPDGTGANYVGITLNNGAVNTGSSGTLPAYDPANPCGGDFHCFETADRYNWQPDNLLATPNRRVNVFTKGEVDLTDSVLFRVTAAYNNRKSASIAASEPLFLGPGGAGGVWMENVVIPANQEYNPFGITLDSSNIDTLARRPVEAGPRAFYQSVDTASVSAGFDGHFGLGGHNWFWDATAGWFRNQANQRKDGDFNARNLSIALGDPAVCAATPRCVPFNFFGGVGSITPEMLDYVTYVEKDESTQTLADFTANLSGDLVDLPAGPLSVAVGAERRRTSGRFIPDAVVAAGETADPPTSPTSGRYKVTELYGETVVPLAKDLPLVHKLEVTGAVRYSDYDLFGSNTVFKAGLDWAPVEDLLVRGNWSEGFRAPNIGELFSTGSRFDAAIADPCSNATGTIAANCATLGVPAGFSAISTQVGLITGGNTGLQPEKSKTTTAGFTWKATQLAAATGLADAVVDFNFYNIRLSRAIEAVNASDILNTCVTTLESFYCDSVSRATTGDILSIDNRLENIGAINTRGIDWSVGIAGQPQDWGRLHAKLSGTNLFRYIEKVPGPDGSTVRTERAGTELGVAGNGLPKFKSSLTLGWDRAAWSVDVTSRYISAITETCGGLTASFAWLGYADPPGPLGLCSNGASIADYYASGDPGTNKIKSRIYTDLQLGWKSTWRGSEVGLQFGVQNVLGESTPVCRSCTINGFDGTLYPIPGRFLYGRASFKL